jgi:hypothetical protein
LTAFICMSERWLEQLSPSNPWTGYWSKDDNLNSLVFANYGSWVYLLKKDSGSANKNSLLFLTH